MSCYDRNNLPGRALWGEYMKIATTKAVRMDGPFKVWTREGLMYCEDGWLALDSGGNPYPIAADEFERTYRPDGDVYVAHPHWFPRAAPVATFSEGGSDAVAGR